MNREEIETVGLGMYFEDLPVGRKFKTLGRTIQDADVCAFINCIHMTEVLFTDMEFVKNESDIK
ncbi:acyl dehydratase, partial [Burkholderia sp. SIMBA_019]